jgi:hypothetical protein
MNPRPTTAPTTPKATAGISMATDSARHCSARASSPGSTLSGERKMPKAGGGHVYQVWLLGRRPITAAPRMPMASTTPPIAIAADLFMVPLRLSRDDDGIVYEWVRRRNTSEVELRLDAG